MSLPKGSPYTKRFGQKVTHKMTHEYGKPVKSQYVRTKLSSPGPVEKRALGIIPLAVGTLTAAAPLVSATYRYNNAPKGHELNHAINGGIGTAMGMGGGAMLADLLTDNDTSAGAAATIIGGLFGHAISKPTASEDAEMEKIIADAKQTYDREKVAVGTGDEDYESPAVGSYGQHKHVEGEDSCYLCKGVPLFESERNERDGDAEKQAENYDSTSADYHEILRMVAEMHGVDLTTPESLEQLPALLREVDTVMDKRKRLESAESELSQALNGGGGGQSE